MRLVAIDPGNNGDIVLHTGEKVITYKMPKSAGDTVMFFQEILPVDFCLIEHEHMRTGYTGMTTFIRKYGWLQAGIEYAGISHAYITPKKWMQYITDKKKKDFKTKTQWKNHLKELAQKIYKDVNVTLWNADALLILKYLQDKQDEFII